MRTSNTRVQSADHLSESLRAQQTSWSALHFGRTVLLRHQNIEHDKTSCIVLSHQHVLFPHSESRNVVINASRLLLLHPSLCAFILYSRLHNILIVNVILRYPLELRSGFTVHRITIDHNLFFGTVLMTISSRSMYAQCVSTSLRSLTFLITRLIFRYCLCGSVS